MMCGREDHHFEIVEPWKVKFVTLLTVICEWRYRKTQSFKDFGTWHLTQDLNMSRVCTRWVLTLLTIENLKNQESRIVEKEAGGSFLDMIVTTYESWFHYYDPETKQQSDQWKNTNSSPPKKAKVTKPFGETQYPQYPMARHMRQ